MRKAPLVLLFLLMVSCGNPTTPCGVFTFTGAPNGARGINLTQSFQFGPSPCSTSCTTNSIAYVQIVRIIDRDTGNFLAPGPEQQARIVTGQTDYAKFLIELIDAKGSDAFRLNNASLTEMLRPQIRVAENDEYVISWGLGWRLVHTKRGDLINHDGYNKGFLSFVEASVEQKSGFVIMTNGENGGELLKKLAPAIARQLGHPTV